jgi:chromosomal replication initiator protein
MRPRDLIAQVAAVFDLTPADLTGPSRIRQVAEARQATAWVLRRAIAAISLQEVGRLLGGRDHTTIIHALAQVERRMADDPYLAAQLYSLLPQTPLTSVRQRSDHAMRWWVAQSRESFFVRAA